MKYKRELSANYYNGCSDRVARQIDVMAGFHDQPIAEQPDYNSYRGANREISSSNNDVYEVMQKKISAGIRERRKQEEIEWMNNSCKQQEV